METLKWIYLGVLVGGSIGYVLGYLRAIERSEVAIRTLQIEWQSTLKALTGDES